MQESRTKIKMFGMDVDGVLTDGSIYYGDMGLEIKRFHVQDGMGVALVRKAGLTPFVITGRRSDAVIRRALELGITEVHQGVDNKLACLKVLTAKYGTSPDEVAYVGDDFSDLDILLHVGFPIAVANARDEVKRAAKFVTSSGGGNGAVREACEWALRLNGQWEALISAHPSGQEPGERSG